MKKTNKKKIEEFIRVDHAGERGAIKIYEGQLLALNTVCKDEKLKETIKTMKLHEKEHLDFFEQEIKKRNINPTKFLPLWDLLGIGLGLKLGDHVALMCPNCIEFIEITCGLSEIGVAPAMINAKSTPSETTYICNDSKAKVLFVHQDYKDIALSCKFETIEKISLSLNYKPTEMIFAYLNNQEFLIESIKKIGKEEGFLYKNVEKLNYVPSFLNLLRDILKLMFKKLAIFKS